MNYGSTLNIKIGLSDDDTEDLTACTSPTSSLSSEIELLPLNDDLTLDDNSATNNLSISFPQPRRHRLHCILIMLSCLILPLATLLFAVCLILLYPLVFIAIFDKQSMHCVRLQSYAIVSAFLLLYNIYDGRVKNIIFRFSRSNLRPSCDCDHSINRIHDLFHFIIYVGYVILGITWTGLLDDYFISYLDTTIHCNEVCPHLCLAARNYVLVFSAFATLFMILSIFTCFGECYRQHFIM